MRLPIWGVMVMLLVVAAYVAPYLLLSEVERWSGTFLFWLVFGLVVWLVLVGAVSRWDGSALPPRNSPAGEERRP